MLRRLLGGLIPDLLRFQGCQSVLSVIDLIWYRFFNVESPTFFQFLATHLPGGFCRAVTEEQKKCKFKIHYNFDKYDSHFNTCILFERNRKNSCLMDQ